MRYGELIRRRANGKRIAHAATLLLGSLVLLSGCSLCNHEVRAEEVSPGGGHSAIVSISNCGAPTPFRTGVTIRPRYEGSHESEHTVFEARGRQTIELLWSSASELVVNCHTCRDEDIEFQISRIGGLKIAYVSPDKTAP